MRLLLAARLQADLSHNLGNPARKPLAGSLSCGRFVMGALYQGFGLPLEGIGLPIALAIVSDMFMTASHVTADLVVATLVSGPATGVNLREVQAQPESVST